MIAVKNLNGEILYKLDIDTLAGADLRRLNFRRANLKGQDFSGANLERANFSDADASDANFSNAVLNNASFKNANISGVKINSKTRTFKIRADGAKGEFNVIYP